VIYETLQRAEWGTGPACRTTKPAGVRSRSTRTYRQGTLRASGNQNLIIAGATNWSQRPDLAADDPIEPRERRVRISLLFRIASPGRVRVAEGRVRPREGVALFCSEWGTSEANGDGGPYLDEADAWIDMMNRNGIGWINWSMTTKSETSGAFRPYKMGAHEAASLDPGSDGKWAPDELSPSGEYARARIKGARFVPVARKDASTVPIEHAEEGYATFPSDFEDGTRQGWSWFGGSPVQSPIIVVNAGGSKALGWAVAYPEAKPEGDWTTAPASWSRTSTSRGKRRVPCFRLPRQAGAGLARRPRDRACDGPSEPWLLGAGRG
jgi:endoglucanase